jgi:uncharacterized membrane protein YphA (DoxX/SURF4 family)
MAVNFPATTLSKKSKVEKMRKKIITKKNAVFLLVVLTGSAFLLSATGKLFSIEAFKNRMVEFGFPPFTAYIIVGVEFAFALGYMFQWLPKILSAFVLSFLFVLTAIYTILHFYLGMGSCDCFGAIDVLNTNHFQFYLLKNAALIVSASYIHYNIFVLNNSSRHNKIFTVLSVLLISFLTFKYNDYYLDNYEKNKLGLPVKSLHLKYSKLNDIDYLFVFSPSCSHCIKALPTIIKLKKRYQLKLAGITLESKAAEWEKLKSGYDIGFDIILVNRDVFNEITKKVPVVYEIRNDTIRNSFSPPELNTKLTMVLNK